MIGRLLIYGSALLFLSRGQGTGRLFQVYRQTMAMRRCVRLLNRSEVARKRGDRAAAEKWRGRAERVLSLVPVEPNEEDTPQGEEPHRDQHDQDVGSDF